MKVLSRKMLTALTVMLAILFSVLPSEAAKKTVAIMPLENISGYTAANVAEIMTEQLIVVIQGSRQYGVVERLQMGTVMSEQGFQNLNAGGAGADGLGALSGSDYTVIGKVTMATTTVNQTKSLLGALFKDNELVDKLANSRKAKIELDVRFVDNKTGEVVFAKTFSGAKSGQNDAMALGGACKEAAENFLKELQNINPFMARVADTSGNDVYIDQGSESGLRKGETLIVARESSPIIVNGKIVGMKSNAVCKIKVVEVFAEYSVCRADKANVIRQGDVVRRDTK